MRERVLKKDLSDRLIVIDPADPEYSVGLNPLEIDGSNDRFMQIAEFSQILKERWHSRYLRGAEPTKCCGTVCTSFPSAA